MFCWNYRVVRKKHKKYPKEVTYHVHEVFYDDTGSIETWTESPVEPMGETISELREDIKLFMHAFRKPVLEEKIRKGKTVLVADDEGKQQINEGHYFELMDRSSVAVDYIYEFLGSHPLIKQNKNLCKVYEKAEQALVDLYQKAGALAFDKEEKGRTKLKRKR